MNAEDTRNCYAHEEIPSRRPGCVTGEVQACFRHTMVPEAVFASASISQPQSSSRRCFRAGLLLRPQFRPCNHHCNNCLADLPASNPQSCPHTLLGAAPSVWSCRPWTVPGAPAAPSPLQDACVTLGWGTSGRWHRQHRSTSTGGSFWPSPAAGPRPSRQTTLSISPRAGMLLGAFSFLPSLLSSPPATPALPDQGSLTLHESLASPKFPCSHHPVSSLLLALMQHRPWPSFHSPTPQAADTQTIGKVPSWKWAALRHRCQRNRHSPSLPGPLPQPCSARPLPLASSGRSTPSHSSDHHLPQQAQTRPPPADLKQPRQGG